jgi:hypothetical protein
MHAFPAMLDCHHLFPPSLALSLPTTHPPIIHHPSSLYRWSTLMFTFCIHTLCMSSFRVFDYYFCDSSFEKSSKSNRLIINGMAILEREKILEGNKQKKKQMQSSLYIPLSFNKCRAIFNGTRFLLAFTLNIFRTRYI